MLVIIQAPTSVAGRDGRASSLISGSDGMSSGKSSGPRSKYGSKWRFVKARGT